MGVQKSLRPSERYCHTRHHHQQNSVWKEGQRLVRALLLRRIPRQHHEEEENNLGSCDTVPQEEGRLDRDLGHVYRGFYLLLYKHCGRPFSKQRVVYDRCRLEKCLCQIDAARRSPVDRMSRLIVVFLESSRWGWGPHFSFVWTNNFSYVDNFRQHHTYWYR